MCYWLGWVLGTHVPVIDVLRLTLIPGRCMGPHARVYVFVYDM